MQWTHLVCLCVVIASLRCSPRNTRTLSASGTAGVDDPNKATIHRNVSSHLGVTEHSNITRSLSTGNSTLRRRKTHRLRKKKSNAFWTKAGTALTGVVQGYNLLRRAFGGANTGRRAGYYDDYESDDYSESEIKPKKRPRRLRAMEATTMSYVEEAYRRALTFTPRYQWDDQTTKRPRPLESVEDEAKADAKSKKLGRRKGKRKNVARKLKPENTANRRPRGKGRGVSGKGARVTENLPSIDRPRVRVRQPEYVPRMPSTSFIRPILSTTGKVIRGLDTLAYYGSYFSYTILPMSIAAVETVKNLLPAPETVARIESSPPFAAL